MLNEILEKDGLALLYRTSTVGVRTAMLFPAIDIPRVIEDLLYFGKDITTRYGSKIITQFLREMNIPTHNQDSGSRVSIIPSDSTSQEST